MAQTFIKIAVDDHSDNFKILTVEGNSVIEFTDSPRPLVYVNGVEHLVTGVVDVLSESGHLISSYYPPEIVPPVSNPEFTVGDTKVCRIQGDRWLVINQDATCIADAIIVTDHPPISPIETLAIQNEVTNVDLLRKADGGKQFLSLSDGASKLNLVNAVVLNAYGFEVVDDLGISIQNNVILGSLSNQPFTANITENGKYAEAGFEPIYIPELPAYTYVDSSGNTIISVMDKNRSPYERVFGLISFLA